MGRRRTDLALEAAEMAALGEDEGFFHKRVVLDGVEVTEAEVRSQGASERLGKARGKYVTVELTRALRHEYGALERVCGVLAGQLRRLLPETGTILVMGLGNRKITPDALGPLAQERVLATRHLAGKAPGELGRLRPVAALAAGVLGTTGVESGELARAVVERVRPGCVIAVDALAAGSAERLCAVAQLSDSGIAPGSGVGNHRQGLNEETLGVKVIALGVPTVVDAGVLTARALERAGVEEPEPEGEETLFVTPRDIDEKVALCAKILGFAIDLAAQPGMTVEELELLVE